ncbi:MaoC/PaaZ C-terminal domain-containing protein [Spongisporangium articulatum]|uniref:MaoC/PaaZ C-terminal domain-containing protein n=1 Tax=Spongisporangium articulatum TaxID=3362603 RepID=A0ABW8AHK8_9ACTN
MSDAMSMIASATGQEPIVVNGDEIRGQSRVRHYSVSAEELAAYAAATGDTRTDRIAGEVASPAFGFVPLTPLLFEVVDEVAGDVGPTGVVHTHQRFTVHESIAAGDELTVTASVADLRGGPFGTVCTILASTVRADGVEVNSQLVTALLVGSTCENPIIDDAYAPGEPPAGVGKPPAGSIPLSIDRDLAPRYADASGDRNPIHLDAAYARNAGFPGTILHGMCTLAMSANALEAKFPEFVHSTGLVIEFTRPVFPGDKLTVKYDVDEAEGGVDLRFEVVNRKMRTVMRGGSLSLRK